MNIRIDNPYGEHGELMTLYRDNVEVTSVTIGSNDPETLQEYLMEFDASPAFAVKLGITQVSDLDKIPKFDNEINIVWIVK